MKIVFKKDELLSALIPAAAIAPNKNTNYILECVLFEYPSDIDNKCRITAYDTEKGLRTYVDCNSDSPVCFAVNSQNILQIVRCMPEEIINIEIDERMRAKIYSGTVSFEIGAASGENYPALPLLSGDKNYVIPQYVFRDLVNKTIFATSQADFGKSFSGVLFKMEKGRIRTVGCDRNMLAVAEYEDEGGCEDNKFIIPAKILSEILKSVKDSEDEMEISVARKHVIFQIGNYLYFSRLIDDDYFNYDKILAIPNNTHVYVNCSDLKYSVERASIVTEDKLGGKSKNSLIINYKKNEMEISSNSANGSIHDVLPIATENLENDMLFKYNCRYIMSILRVCEETKTLKISLSGPTMGMRITSGDSGEEKIVDYIFYVMPMNNVK